MGGRLEEIVFFYFGGWEIFGASENSEGLKDPKFKLILAGAG